MKEESWYETHGSPAAYDEYFDRWVPHTQRQAEKPWPYKIYMASRAFGLVLDAGCGPGVLSRHIENGVFLDFSRVALIERWTGSPRPRILASIEDMPFRDAVFDTVLASEVIEHTDNPERFTGEVHRVLKPNGLFIFSFPWSDVSPTHKFKRITLPMIEKWLHPFPEFEVVEHPSAAKLGRAIISTHKSP